MDASIRSRVLMVTKVPKKLVKWWGMFNPSEQYELKDRLGALLSLFYITPRPDLIEAMITYWDPEKMVFRFGECEMTPTLAELSGLTRLPYIDKDMILARDHSRTRFLNDCGLKDNGHLGCLRESWISVDYLYARFGPSDAFDDFWDEFCTTKKKWERRRLEVFSLALLGILVFPLDEKHIDIRLQSVVMALFHKDKGKKVTVIPLILAEIYRALSEVRGGVRFFEGSNLLLQLWMMEHLHSPSLIKTDVIDRCIDDRVGCIEHRMQFDKFALPVGVVAWVEFLGSRTHENILWSYLWLRPNVILVGCRMQPLLVLIGLRCTRPYTPIRVMRQLGRLQDVPPSVDLRSDMEYFRDKALREIMYEKFWRNAEKLRGNSIVRGSDNPGCTQEYWIWLQSVPRGISTPLPAQLRGRAPEADIVQEAEDLGLGAKIEMLKVQLAGLVTDVEAHQSHLLRGSIQEAGVRARAFVPSIKMSLQRMLQSLSSNGGARTSQPGHSQAPPAQPTPSHQAVASRRCF